jgi:hypothetical protein
MLGWHWQPPIGGVAGLASPEHLSDHHLLEVAMTGQRGEWPRGPGVLSDMILVDESHGWGSSWGFLWINLKLVDRWVR